MPSSTKPRARFAAWLQSRGLKRGARVAIMMPNVLQYPVAIAAILRAGCTVVNVNPLYKPRELEFQLTDAGAEAIIVLENFAAVLQQALPSTQRQARRGRQHGRHARHGEGHDGQCGGAPYQEDGAGLRNPGRHHVQRRARRRPRAGVQRRPRSGPTTSPSCNIPAAPPASPRARCCRIAIWSPTCCRWKRGISRWSTCRRKIDHLIIVTALPLYHIFALTACFLLGVRIGGVCLLIPNPRDIPGLIKELAQLQGEHVPGGEHALQRAAAIIRISARSTGACSSARSAAAWRCRKPVADAWLKATGRPIIEGYGLSETSPVLTCNRGDISEWTGTIGLPVPSTEISIRDDDDHEVPLGEQGEICARGPQVMAGYWQRPDETAKVMTADGFFRTGDIGVMDEQGRVAHRRPQEGHDLGVRLQGIPQRGRGSGHEPGRLARMRRRRRAGRTFRRGGQAVRGEEERRTSPRRNCAPSSHASSPATRCRSRSSSATNCRRPMSARFCGARCAMSEASSRQLTEAMRRRAADVVAFWREAGPEALVQEGRRPSTTRSASAFSRPTKPPPPASLPTGSRAPKARWRCSSCSTSFRATCFAATRAPLPPTRWRAPSRPAPSSRGFDGQVPNEMRGFFYLPFEHSEDLADQERCVALLQGDRRCRRSEMGGNSRRHHPPLRPVSRTAMPCSAAATTPEEQAFLDGGGFAG